MILPESFPSRMATGAAALADRGPHHVCRFRGGCRCSYRRHAGDPRTGRLQPVCARLQGLLQRRRPRARLVRGRGGQSIVGPDRRAVRCAWTGKHLRVTARAQPSVRSGDTRVRELVQRHQFLAAVAPQPARTVGRRRLALAGAYQHTSARVTSAHAVPTHAHPARTELQSPLLSRQLSPTSSSSGSPSAIRSPPTLSKQYSQSSAPPDH